jgi:hypothetical protein
VFKAPVEADSGARSSLYKRAVGSAATSTLHPSPCPDRSLSLLLSQPEACIEAGEGVEGRYDVGLVHGLVLDRVGLGRVPPTWVAVRWKVPTSFNSCREIG